MGPLATNNNNAIRKKKTAILPSIENEKLHFTQKKKKKTCTVVWCVKGNALTSHQSPLLFEQMKNILARRVLTLILRPHRQHSPSNFYCFSSFSWPFSTASSPPPPPNNKLFVGGLSWSINEKTLKDAFSSFGEVSEVRIVYDKETGRPRGFGFVHFSMEEDARCAKEAMDGKPLLGRPLRITFALDKVRGGAPVVVPRLWNSEIASGENDLFPHKS
ncbi:hypothetical protein M9H77_04501 [Catharanthus roseus]|uniref:Uncharacterized protein n=1 Tax=Catharanthus roseus TaxID=4058 RepID=A0ACC0CE68_CATRO|nr:hypothetical protein M9H77_04501 [Catharanthus roseus]